MQIKWWQVAKAIPEINAAVEPCTVENKDWYASKTIWYNIAKAGFTMAAALGIYEVASASEVETISVALSVAIPAVCTLLDAATNIWLRYRTDRGIGPKVQAGSNPNTNGTAVPS